MKRGINIGDHFENTYDTTVPFENPVKEWYYPLIKKLGFDHVRIPVRWSIWTDDDNGYKINEEFMVEVEKTVKRFLDEGLEVILNVHHFREAMDKPRENAEKLFAIWEQVGARFAGYSDALIFEVMNEPTWRTTAEEWNEVQAEAVEVIRKTNPTRRIEVCSVDYSGLVALDRLEIPKDDNLIATFHFHDPFPFTHQGAAWSPTMKDVSGIRWEGTPDDEEFIEARIIAHAKNFSRTHGNIEMNLGEFGAYGKTALLEDRVKWTRCVRKACEKLGYSWTYWEFNRGFGIADTEGNVNEALVEALLGE